MKHQLLARMLALIRPHHAPVIIDLAKELELIEAEKKPPGPTFTKSGGVNLPNLMDPTMKKKSAELTRYAKSRRAN